MKIITLNKQALHNYEIITRFDAGLVLVGTEVKSLRMGRMSIKEAFVLIRNGEAFLVNSHVSPYDHASHFNHDPLRERKLLLNKQEIRKLDQKVKERGFSIVPLKVYFSERGLAKVEIALAKGRREYAKKDKIKERDIKREVDRELKRFR